MKSIHIINCVVLGAVIGLSGCASRAKTSVEPASPRAEVQVLKAPGVVEYIWEEPMVDVIDVPPGLDPEGHYYRPAHQSIVEIRQGRFRHYKETKEMGN